MKTRCELCGEELILSPTGHQWCIRDHCRNGMGVRPSHMLWVHLNIPLGPLVVRPPPKSVE